MNFLLVTGATGFLGSLLVEKLLQDEHRVVGIGRRKKGFLSDDVLNNKNFIFVQADINGQLKHYLSKYKIDGIFHLASCQPSSKVLNYDDFYKGNVATTRQIIEFIKNRRIKFLVYTSTTSVNAKSTKKYLDENSFSYPTTYYSLTKYIAEKLLEIELASLGIKVIIIKYPSIFGKNHVNGLIHTYYKILKSGKDLKIFNNGNIYRSFIYEKDAVQILINAASNIDRLKKFDLFFAGSKDSIKLIKLAEILKRLLGSESRLLVSSKKTSIKENILIDITKAQKILHFDPMTVERGLKKYIAEVESGKQRALELL